MKGSKFGTDLVSMISLVEIGGLLVVIFIGLPALARGFVVPELVQLPAILYGTAVIFFAFLGFEELVRMSEETKDAARKMPIALLAAIALSSVLFVLVSASSIGLVGAEELGRSTSPLAAVVKPSLGETGFFLMSLAGLLSTFNTVLLILLATSRLLYGMGKAATVPALFGILTRSQPLHALIATIALSTTLLILNDITILAQMTDALLFSVFAVMNSVVILLHWRRSPSVFRVPFDLGRISIPAVLGMISSAGMLFFVDRHALLYAVGLVGLIALLLFFRPTERGSIFN